MTKLIIICGAFCLIAAPAFARGGHGHSSHHAGWTHASISPHDTLKGMKTKGSSAGTHY